jgi:hypothetical protein
LAQRELRGREERSAHRALAPAPRALHHPVPVITTVHRVSVPAWPPGWEDVEVVDSVLVEEPPAPEPPGPAGGAYTRFGRPAEAGRYGRLVSVLA